MKLRLLLVGIVLLVGALYYGLYDMPRRNALHGKEAVIGQGRIVGKDTEAGRRGKTHFLATVQFKDRGGKLQRVANRYDQAVWNGIRAGKKVQVRYLPSDPQNAVAEGAHGSTKRDPVLDWGILAGLAVGGAAFLVLGLARRE
ncbi:MAG: DUF3592 domain-containing protein [Armatimonadota bacterium]